MNQQLSAVLEGLAWEEFREARLPERFRDKIAVVIPAYNEADSIGDVLRADPARGLRGADRGPGGRRRLARRHQRGGGEGTVPWSPDT